MAQSQIQRSFAGGEIAAALYGRADQNKYQTGLKTCRNFVVMRHGGVANRAGSPFINEVKDSTKRTYFIKFVYNDDQTYVIEVGAGYLRFIRAGARIVVSGVAAYNGATAYVVGDLVSSAGVNYYCIAPTTGNAPPNATYWYALTGTIYEIPTPYVQADLSTLQFVQSKDVVTITHPNYDTRDLTRTGHTTWVLATVTFQPSIAQPDNGAGVAGVAGAAIYRYRVTAVKADTYEESLPGFSATQAITGITQANPGVLTYVGADPANGDEFYLAAIGGMTQLNGTRVKVANVNAGANTYELTDPTTGANIDTTAYGAYTAGGTMALTCIKITSGTPTDAAPNALSFAVVSGTVEYNVYREKTPGNGIYGFIGIAASNAFNDNNITPDSSITPPSARNPFSGSGNRPSCVSYYQQRQMFANTDNAIEKVCGSRSGMFKNLTISSPLQDDDAVTFSIAGRKAHEIRHMIEIGELVILTAGGEWVVLGDQDGILKANKPPNLKQIGDNGSSTIIPAIVNDSLIYVQARGSIVRDLRYEVSSTGGAAKYSGRDLTVFSPHLFTNKTLERMDFAQNPHSIVWIVRSDGILIGLTYLREHEVWGWHRHDTDGYYEEVCVVPEGSEDAVYVIVRRTINGVTKRYIERFASRNFTDIEVDAKFLDSMLTYDGRNTGATTMTLSTGGGWTINDELTITASAGYFVAGDVGNAIVMWSGDDEITVNITSYVNATTVRGYATKTVPAALRSTALTTWGKAVDVVSGLDHLEGKSIAALGDGHVIANPNNASYTTVTVTAGIATFDRPYLIIHAGLSYLCDIETLDLDTTDEQIRDRYKDISSISLLVESERGLWVGQDADNLSEVQPEPIPNYGEPVPLKTGLIEVNIASTWEQTGGFMVRQKDPLPATVLSAIPNGMIGG